MKKLIALSLALVLALSLCACGGVDERYTPLIECLENHDYEGAMGYVMMLRQEAIDNGDIVVVEPQEEDYELVERYRNVAWFLMNYTPMGYNNMHNSETDEWLEGNDALAYCYAELQALEGVDQWLTSEYFDFEEGFPTDRAALLSRFSNVGLKLIKTVRNTVDNMGNQNTNEGSQWFYDEAGGLNAQYVGWNDSDALWEDFYSRSGYYRYTYNDAGVVTETKITDRENTSVYALIVPTYDENGYLVSETITDNNGEYVFTYTNDANGNRIQMDYNDGWSDYSVFYTYDEAGNLIQKDKCQYEEWSDFTYVTYQTTTVYTYDASGNLTASTITYQDIGTNWVNGAYETYVYSQKVDTAAYTNDVDGNRIQEVWQYGNREYHNGESNNPEYTSETVDYIYADYYIFN